MWAPLIQVIPAPPAPEDTNGVLLWGLTLAIVGGAWMARRYIGRLEKTLDEMTPLLRDQTTLLRDGERRDGEQAALLKEILAELREERRPRNRGTRV